MAETGSRNANKPAGTATVLRRDPDEERRRTKQGLVRERVPRPGRSFGGDLPSRSLEVGRTVAPSTGDVPGLEETTHALLAGDARGLEATTTHALVAGDVRELDELAVPATLPAPASAPPPALAAIAAPASAPAVSLGAPSGLLALSEPGDTLEREADEAADRVVRRLAVAPGGAGDASPRPPEPPPSHAGGLLVQRASLVEVVAHSAGLIPRMESPTGLIVDDQTETLSPGQMKKTPFLARLREVACETAERELRRAGRSARNCPYIDEILGRFARRAPDQLERAIRRYAPEARSATRARDYLPPVATRLGQGIAAWVRTGRMPDNLPDEFRPGRLSGFLEVGASLGRAAVRALRKPTAGAAGSPGIDAAALAGQLGPGRPLDGAARTRMESAFGHPFGDVRIHVDDRAAALSRELEARAFTLGSHVAFGAGQFHPGTPVGDALLAHELAHVVQQRGARPSPGDVETEQPGALEHDADVAAAAAIAALHVKVRPRRRWTGRGGGLRLQRCSSDASLFPDASPRDQRAGTRLPDKATQERVLTELDLLHLVRPPEPAAPAAAPAAGPAAAPAVTPAPTPEVAEAARQWDGIAAPPVITPAKAADNRKDLKEKLFKAVDDNLRALVPLMEKQDKERIGLDPFLGPAKAAKRVVDARFAQWISPKNLALTSSHAKLLTEHKFSIDPADPKQNLLDAGDEAQLIKAGIALSAPGEFSYEIDHLPDADAAMGPHNYHRSRSAPEKSFFTAIMTEYVAIGDNEKKLKLVDRLHYARAQPGQGLILIQTNVPGGKPVDLAHPSREVRQLMWDMFGLVVHEYIHNLAHPRYRAAANNGVLVEGFTEMFTKEVLLELLPTAHDDATLREEVEGGDFGADASVIRPFEPASIYKADMEKAEQIRTMLGSPTPRPLGSCKGRPPPSPDGFNAVKAAYFQGHIELLGLGVNATGEVEAGPTAEPDRVSIPPGVTTIAELAVASGVPEDEVRRTNPGLTEPLKEGTMVKLVGCRDHLVVVDQDAPAGPVTTESRAAIATVNGVDEAALNRANPKLTADKTWGSLGKGQRILIPRH